MRNKIFTLWEFRRRNNLKNSVYYKMSDDSVRIDITRNNSKHLSCRQLRERIEEEMEDTNSISANAKRELDAKYLFYSLF